MSNPLLEAFEAVAQAQRLLPRLDAAAAELAKVSGLAEEKAWLDTARGRLRGASEGTASDLLIRTLRLPELEAIRPEHARAVQGLVVDALEQLHAAIVVVAGPRAALLEALYFKLKIPVLRKCTREEFEAFYKDFEKRLRSTYAKRMLADSDYASVVGSVESFRRSFETWRNLFAGDSADGDEANALRAELETAATRMELAGRQSRLLAQAALAPLRDFIDVAQLLALDPKRKAKEDNHPLLERDPPDPKAPTPEEQAELDA